MGTAKFFEEKLERAYCGLADVQREVVHPAIAKSRTLSGRVPTTLTPEALAAKRTKVEERLTANHRRRDEQSRSENQKRVTAVEAKARELLTVLQPRISQQNDRLLKHVKMLEALVNSQAAELARLRKRLGS